MTIRHLYPAVEPSLNLDFANSKRLDSRITFTRGSTATYTDESGIIRTAAANEARFDHDSDGNSLGLLVEESRNNLVRYSEDFASWLIPSTATENTTTSPSGGTAVGVNNASHTTMTAADPSALTFSCYAKAGSSNYVSMRTVNWGTLVRVWYNLSDGSVGSTTPVTSNITNIQSQEIGDGWYRISFTLDSTGDSTGGFQITATDADLNTNAVGYVYAWGAQLEQGSFPTSYIPTSGSTVTRSADVASITGTNFSSWYNQSEGSFYVKEDSINNSLDKYYIFVSDGANNDRLWLSKDSVRRHVFRVYDSANTLQVVSTSPVLPTSPGLVSSQFVGAYFSGDSNSALNGSIVGASLNNTFVRSGSNSAYLGSTPSGNFLNGHISRLTYYPKRLPDATLQVLTL